MNQQLIDDLKATRRLLETHGRCTGTLWDVRTNTFCLDGAISKAVFGQVTTYTTLNNDPRSRAICVAIAALVKDVPIRGNLASDAEKTVAECAVPHDPAESCWIFNDWTLATDQDVYDVLEKAIAEAGGMA